MQEKTTIWKRGDVGGKILSGIHSGLKSAVNQTKKVLATSKAKSKMNSERSKLRKQTEEQIQEITTEYLRRFNFGQIVALGRICRLSDMKDETRLNSRGRPYTKRVRREFNDYVKQIPDRSDIFTILDFGGKLGVPETYEFRQMIEKIKEDVEIIDRKIVEEFRESYARINNKEFPLSRIDGYEEREDLEEGKKEPNGYKDPRIEMLIEKINEFHPPKLNQHIEVNYQLMLYGFLQASFPEITMEEQRGSSRPDLNLKNIGIEIKGPTYDQGLQTIADKLLRYPHLFKDGIIVVLYDVQVHPRRYDEWLNGVKMKHPDAIIIRK